MAATRTWPAVVLCALAASVWGCRGGPGSSSGLEPGDDGGAGDSGDPDGALRDGAEGPDPDGDGGPPGCVLDDSVDQEAQCLFAQIDIARDVPGGEDRVRYMLPVTAPYGDYDPACARMDEVTVTTRDGTVVRRGEAVAWGGGFVIEGRATDLELAVCEGAERIAVFQIYFNGSSPAGTFHGTCGCGCLSWTLSAACHRGVEAAVAVDPWIGSDIYPEGAATLSGRGVIGNHGSAPLGDVEFERTTWRALDAEVDPYVLEPADWTFFGPWLEPIPRDDWSDEQYFQWQSAEALPPEALCPRPSSGIEAPLTQLVLSGRHSAGAFEIESHPFWCSTPDE